MLTGPFVIELEQLKRPNTTIAFTAGGVPGVKEAQRFATSGGARITCVAAPLASTAQACTKGPTISERTYGVRLKDSDTALVIAPSLKLLAKVLNNHNATLIIGEWPTTPLRRFGRLTSAFDILSGERMVLSLEPTMFKLLKDLDWAGNNGWSDRPGKRDAIRLISEMKSRDDFEPEPVTSSMLLNNHSVDSIEYLRKLMKG